MKSWLTPNPYGLTGNANNRVMGTTYLFRGNIIKIITMENIEQQAINEILESSEGNIYTYVQKIRRRMKLYFFLLVVSVLGNAFMVWAWSDAIRIAKMCIAGM